MAKGFTLFVICLFIIQISSSPTTQCQQYLDDIIITDLRLRSNTSRLELNNKIEYEFQKFQIQTFNLTNTILSEINETMKVARERIKKELGDKALQAANASLNAVAINGVGGVFSCLNLSVNKVTSVASGILRDISKGFDIFVSSTEIVRGCNSKPVNQRVACILEREKLLAVELAKLVLNFTSRVVTAVEVISNLQASFFNCVNQELMKVAIIVAQIALDLVSALTKI